MEMAEIDIERFDTLVDYLRQSGRIAGDEQVKLQVLTGGVSNRTVLVERTNGERWVLKQALAKLRVAVDWFSDPIRIRREALGLRWLADLAPPGTITPLVFEDEQHYILAMQAVPEPHANWKTLLLAGQLDRDHAVQFGCILGEIHRHASERRAEVEPVFADQSFFESLRIEPYYRYTAQQLPEAARFYGALIDETYAARLTLVHGDYSPKNVLVYQDRLVLLDHEVIHWGDPAFDLGFGLTHLLSKAHHLRAQRVAFAQAAAACWAAYAEALGDVAWRPGVESRAVRHTLGCCLARVSGRSPMDYLAADERVRQRLVVLDIIQQPPQTIAALIDTFLNRLQLIEETDDANH